MSSESPRPEIELDALRERISELVAVGRFDDALALADEAVRRAESSGDVERLDLAVCARAALLIARGEGRSTISALRRILMRSTNASNRFRAAYAISQFHDEREELDKSRFYARQALHYAEATDDSTLIGRAFNRLGNLALVDSYFEDARDAYRQALGLQDAAPSLDDAILLSNLGYCEIVLGEVLAGYRNLVASLRAMRRLGASRWLFLPRLGLSYAHLELGRYPSARRHAADALELAERAASDNHVKNALYLLGEAEKLCGDDAAARDCFRMLKDRFYPDQPIVVDVLMSADIRQLVHLMA
ncbi:MAG: hypothetical protein AAGN46_01650 [Acidobacteriota bacterium]